MKKKISISFTMDLDLLDEEQKKLLLSDEEISHNIARLFNEELFCIYPELYKNFKVNINNNE